MSVLHAKTTDRRTLLRAGLTAPLLTALLGPARSSWAAPAHNPGGVSGTNAEDNSFTAIITDGSSDIDPHSTYITIGSTICLGCYEMLIQYKGDSTTDYAPMLAESWESNEDGSVHTFKIPAGVKFHDGTDCDANAVKYSYVRFHRMQMGPYLVIARFVDNPEEQIVVVDAQTIQFNLGKPQPLFLAAMASSYGPFVLSPTAVEQNKTDEDPWAHEFFLMEAVGTGPYRLIENNLKEQIVFEKFDEYHGGWDGAHFDNIILRVVPENAVRRQLIEQGEADATTNNLTPEDSEGLKSVSGVTVLEYATTRNDYCILNAVKLSIEARQGLCYAFPYQEVIDGVYRGLLKRTGPIASTVRGFDPNVFLYPTDLAKAAELLTAGGLPAGSTIDMLIISEEEIDKGIAQLFQAKLSEIGYNLQIDQVDTSTLNDIIFGDQPGEEKPMIIGSWSWWPDYNDPWNHLAPLFLKSSSGGGGANAGYWVNDRFEELMAQARDVTDAASLDALMIEAQNILVAQDPAGIFLGERQYFTALRSEIQGFVANPLYLNCYNYYGMSRNGGY